MSIVIVDSASSNDVAAVVKDILVIPTSKIALEKIFSKRVKMLDTYRSALSLRIA